jgi:starch-binding outer membrane protein, SusD/RagB family
MKKHAYLTLFVFGLASCEVLDQKPELQIADEQAITNRSGADAALAGMYNQLQEVYQGRLQRLSDVSSDVAQSVGTWDFYREMDTYSVSPDNTELLDIWTFAYRGVNIANNVITGVPQINDIPQATKDAIVGQAHFVRGLLFFELVRIWGGVPNVVGTGGIPIPKEPSRAASSPARASLQETYAQIESDLQKAEQLLPTTLGSDALDRGRATKLTAKALMSRLYMYTRTWAKTEQFATEVLADARFKLNPNYNDIFEGKNTSEGILELQYNSSDQSSVRFWYAPCTIGGRGELAVHDGFYNELIDSKDNRGRLFARDNVARVWYPTKYIKGGNIDNTHVLRVAEMHLNRAEARAQTNNVAGALADLNAVRARAGLAAIAATTPAAVLLAIEEERRREFAFEGHRWFDLVRTGRALTVLAAVGRTNSPGAPASLKDSFRQIMPIPTQERNANANVQQNDGYK